MNKNIKAIFLLTVIAFMFLTKTQAMISDAEILRQIRATRINLETTKFSILNFLDNINKKFKRINDDIKRLESEFHKYIRSNKETYKSSPSLWQWRGELYHQKLDLLLQQSEFEIRLREINNNLRYFHGTEEVYEY